MARNLWVAFLIVFLLGGAYATTLLTERIGSQLFGVLSFGALGALEAVIALWLVLRGAPRMRPVLGHALVAAGCVCLSLSSLGNGNLMMMAIGTPLAIVGAMIIASELKARGAV